MLPQKTARMIGTKGRVTIPQRMFDAIGTFENNHYLVIKIYGQKYIWEHPTKERRVTLPFEKGDVIVMTYDPFKGKYFEITEIYPISFSRERISKMS